MSEDRRSTIPMGVSTGVAPLVEARFIPQRYEPNYAYPLLVMFHGRGCDEQQMLRSMPAMSWRNYVGLSLRGPEAVSRRDREGAFGWGSAFARPDRRKGRLAPESIDLGVLKRRLQVGSAGPIDAIEEGAFNAIRQARRTLHVHSERIFLMGVGEGAAVAYRLGLTYPERFAGVVAINGWVPGGFRPLGRLKDCRDLKILAVHGEWNGRAPVQAARRDVASLRAGGLRVAFQSYPCAHRLTSPMLSDVDTWLINQCTADL